jgi:hypothetical protein
VTPEQRTFERHLAAGPFQAGVERGEWRFISSAWPDALIAVSAPAHAGSPREYALHFELSDYPRRAPTAAPWDAATDQPLPDALWPSGGQASEVFNPGWNRNALYIPCDHFAIQGHADWPARYQPYLWTATSDITLYLRIVRDVLHRPGYTGVRQQAA